MNNDIQKGNTTIALEDIPIACVLDAIPEAQFPAYEASQDAVFTGVQQIVERETGFEFVLSLEALPHLGVFINSERLCCPFLEFGINLQPQAETVSLTISGGEGVKAFLQQELVDRLAKVE